MILVIDNYDSFTYNLVQYLGELGEELVVHRNDALSVAEIAALKPARILISPGPGRPEDAGVSLEVIKTLGPTTPVLGVCLGHQAIGLAYGGIVRRANRPMHGKTSRVVHTNVSVFAGLPTTIEAGRYHSLVVADEQFPAELEVTARTEDDGTIMGLRHRTFPVHGVQFHPESVLTPDGKQMLRNFLAL
jgi:anthranilate synthase/aminodeoxychorismate synthase-like glutamine amidotransferase